MKKKRNIYEVFARQQAIAAGIDPDIFARQIRQESGFNPSARSGAGAIGIAQIVPKYHPGVNPNDPYASLKWSARYMSGLVHKYGSYAKALSVYNSGQPNKYQDPNFAGGQTYNYVKSIMGGQSPQALNTGFPGATPSLASPPVRTKNTSLALLRGLLADQPIPSLIKAVQPAAIPAVNRRPVSFTTDHAGPLSPNAPGIVNAAKQYLGTKYVWGGTTPKGFDCSGFVQYLYKQKGINLPRTTYQQIKVGKPVGRDQLQPGDAVFFSKGGDVHHEGLYIGHGQFIHAPHTGDVVKISSLSDPYYQSQFAGGRRYG